VNPFKMWAVARAATAVFLCAHLASAEASNCSNAIGRDNLVLCALHASLAAEAQTHVVEASRARETAVSPLLPSNPVLGTTIGRRSIPGGVRTTNWYASLSQELEVAGQRGARKRAAQAEVSAEVSRLRLSQREVAVEAWSRYFEALAAREELALTTRLAAAAQELSNVVSAKADKGILAPVDADVTDAVLARNLQAKFSAERHERSATSALVSLLGDDPSEGTVTVAGELVPLNVDRLASLGFTAPTERPEVVAAEADRQSMVQRAEAFRRSRVPNPTLSIFVEDDGFNERVFGAGLSIPIPLPGNLGRTYLGEIAESEALARKASSERELVRRGVRLEVVSALQAYESRQREISVLTPEKAQRAGQTLEDLRGEVEAGRLPVRDAIVAQQSLVEFLQGELSARLELCLASVALARAVGFPLERQLP
jgi:cobalt-zinc-cadmium efflux system outer membrane protein